MTAFVLDASVALSWCFGDEATPATQHLLDQLANDRAIVPGLWPLELGNILVSAERRGRIGAARLAEFVALIDALDIEVDTETPERGLGAILALARSEKLTTYDAAYLELAMRLGLPLATKDQALRVAATRNGVTLLGV